MIETPASTSHVRSYACLQMHTCTSTHLLRDHRRHSIAARVEPAEEQRNPHAWKNPKFQRYLTLAHNQFMAKTRHFRHAYFYGNSQRLAGARSEGRRRWRPRSGCVTALEARPCSTPCSRQHCDRHRPPTSSHWPTRWRAGCCRWWVWTKQWADRVAQTWRAARQRRHRLTGSGWTACRRVRAPTGCLRRRLERQTGRQWPVMVWSCCSGAACQAPRAAVRASTAARTHPSLAAVAWACPEAFASFAAGFAAVVAAAWLAVTGDVPARPVCIARCDRRDAD